MKGSGVGGVLRDPDGADEHGRETTNKDDRQGAISH